MALSETPTQEWQDMLVPTAAENWQTERTSKQYRVSSIDRVLEVLYYVPYAYGTVRSTVTVFVLFRYCIILASWLYYV